MTWSDIAGLDDVITDLKDTVILPIRKKHLFENSRLLQPPKGIVRFANIHTPVYKFLIFIFIKVWKSIFKTMSTK